MARRNVGVVMLWVQDKILRSVNFLGFLGRKYMCLDRDHFPGLKGHRKLASYEVAGRRGKNQPRPARDAGFRSLCAFPASLQDRKVSLWPPGTLCLANIRGRSATRKPASLAALEFCPAP